MALQDDVVPQAMQLIQAGDYAQACMLLRPYSRSGPRITSAVWNLLGICETELQRPHDAEAAFRQGLKAEPKSVPLHENLGLLYFRIGQYPAARDELTSAERLGSTNPRASFSLAAATVRTGDASGGLNRLLRLEPQLAGESAYWTERGWVELSLQRHADAARSFERALALAPTDVRALNGAATAAENDHDDEKALSLLLAAQKAAPDDVNILLHLGSVCLRRDLVVDAEKTLKHAMELAPHNSLALFLYARANIAEQHWHQAHDLLSEFDRQQPDYAPAQFALGWLEIKLNQPQDARAHLEQAIALDPQQMEARTTLARLFLDQDQDDAAWKQVRIVLEALPNDAKANLLAGDLLLKEGRLQEAESRYQHAARSDPKSGPAHYKLSTVLMRLHQPEEARKERQIGTQLNAEAEKSSKTVLVLAEPNSNQTGEQAIAPANAGSKPN